MSRRADTHGKYGITSYIPGWTKYTIADEEVLKVVEILRLPDNTLPQFDRKVTLRKWGASGHTYKVDGFPCTRCAQCTGRSAKDRQPKPQSCTGMTSCSTISGMYMKGNMYAAGRKSGFDTIFGEYGDEKKNSLQEGGSIVNHRTQQQDLLKLRMKGEALPSKSSIARDFGNRVHEALEAILGADKMGVEYFVDPDLEESTYNITEWLASHEYNVLDFEVTVYHPEMLYAGKVDCVAERGGNISLFDWKTGGLYKNAQVQLAGYAMAYKEITGIEPTAAWVLRSNRQTFEAARVGNLDAAKLAFKSLHAAKVAWDNLTWADQITTEEI
jgi:hypothetical protein